VHPLQAGLLRLKYRKDRRPGLPIEPAWRFYPRYAWGLLSKPARVAARWIELERLRRQARAEHKRKPYMDAAVMPVSDNETETLEMFTHNAAARSQVAHIRKVAALTSGKAPTPHHA